jgi:hypothetical protein
LTNNRQLLAVVTGATLNLLLIPAAVDAPPYPIEKYNTGGSSAAGINREA